MTRAPSTRFSDSSTPPQTPRSWSLGLLDATRVGMTMLGDVKDDRPDGVLRLLIVICRHNPDDSFHGLVTDEYSQEVRVSPNFRCAFISIGNTDSKGDYMKEFRNHFGTQCMAEQFNVSNNKGIKKPLKFLFSKILNTFASSIFEHSLSDSVGLSKLDTFAFDDTIWTCKYCKKTYPDEGPLSDLLSHGN